MCRRSSSSVSNPSRTNPPSRASAGGSSAMARSIHSRSVRQVVELAEQALTSGAWHSDSSSATPRHRRQRLATAPSRSRGPAVDERDARDQPLEILDRLQRLADLAAIGGPERELFDRVEPIANRLRAPSAGGAARRAAAGRPSASRCDRSRPAASPSRPPVAGLDDLEMLQRRGIDQQAVGELAQAHRADVREVGLLRVAKVRTSAPPAQTAAWRRSRPNPSRLLTRSCSISVWRADSSSKCQPSISVIGAADLRNLRNQRRDVVAGRDDDLARPQHRNLVAQAPADRRRRGTRRRRTHRSTGRSWRRRRSPPDAPVHPRTRRTRSPTDRHQERRLARVEIRRRRSACRARRRGPPRA